MAEPKDKESPARNKTRYISNAGQRKKAAPIASQSGCGPMELCVDEVTGRGSCSWAAPTAIASRGSGRGASSTGQDCSGKTNAQQSRERHGRDMGLKTDGGVVGEEPGNGYLKKKVRCEG
ncbi:hypothetical protein VCV18_005790 [Metarhizium anisopliae]